MLTPYQLSIFLPAAFIVAISPGANNILSLSHGALAGFYPTVFSLTGRFLAFSLMLLPVAAGLGAAIAASEIGGAMMLGCAIVLAIVRTDHRP